LTLGDGKVYFTGANALQLLDMETGMRRVPTSEDCARLTRVFDAPEHVHAILPAVIPQDVPQGISDRVKCKISYENCEKHYLTDVYGKESCISTLPCADTRSRKGVSKTEVLFPDLRTTPGSSFIHDWKLVMGPGLT
jgi:trimethylamine:corrinoid methyltransferase-like protein